MQTLIDVILPVFLVIGFGYVAVWRGIFPAKALDGNMGFAPSIALPCPPVQALGQTRRTSWREKV